MDQQPFDSLWVNAHLAAMTHGRPYGTIRRAALGVTGGRISWIGPEEDLPADRRRSARETRDAEGRWITPGLIDCHTHLVYAGSRFREFEMRLLGATYEEIARQGGGIRATVAATRATGEDELFSQAANRLAGFLAEGVTALEIKSGYGLDLDTELKMLRTARRLGLEFPVTVHPTFLGAHAVPEEFEGRVDDYVDYVCETVLPEVKRLGLAVAVDAFCENIAFSPEQTEKLFDAARRLSLRVKIHAGQLTDRKGAELAARFKALSADHLEHLSEEGVRAMAAAGTVAVLLPGAFYFLRETHLPPIDLLRKHGVPMALASDANPGSCPAASLLLMLNMACTLFRLTPEEALTGVTRHGALALGDLHRAGTLEPGKDADFVVWDIEEPAELAYRLGGNPAHCVVRGGQVSSFSPSR